MSNERTERIIKMVDELKNTGELQNIKNLQFDKCIRLIKRLDIFSTDCEICHNHFIDLEEHLIQLKGKQLNNDDIKLHKQKMHSISAHLQKQHKLIPEGYYMGLYMSIGMSLGVVFGLTIFDNLALGLPIGMVIGMGIGSGLDADAKKKGKTI